MIARAWHGAVPAAKADAYFDYLNQTGIPEYKATEGNQGVYVLRRTEGDVTHFLLISLWNSYNSIRGFAGDDIDAAHYYDEDRAYLLELEPKVVHYEVLDAPQSGG